MRISDTCNKVLANAPPRPNSVWFLSLLAPVFLLPGFLQPFPSHSAVSLQYFTNSVHDSVKVPRASELCQDSVSCQLDVSLHILSTSRLSTLGCMVFRWTRSLLFHFQSEGQTVFMLADGPDKILTVKMVPFFHGPDISIQVVLV